MLPTHLSRLACEGLSQKIAEHWPRTKQCHCYVAEHFLEAKRIKVTLYQHTKGIDVTFHCCVCGDAELFSASSKSVHHTTLTDTSYIDSDPVLISLTVTCTSCTDLETVHYKNVASSLERMAECGQHPKKTYFKLPKYGRNLRISLEKY